MKLVVTIDGPAGSGKSTISRLLAEKMHLLYLDTGAMYRAVALAAQRQGLDVDQGALLGEMCQRLDLNFDRTVDPPVVRLGKEDVSAAIRTPEMDMLSSKISTVREVREEMTKLQRKIGDSGGLIAEGRDMGTVVFPQAGLKIFLTASLEERVERRYRERVNRGERMSRKRVRSELEKRDEQDSLRALAPLRPAEDAEIIDTSCMRIDQVVEYVEKIYRKMALKRNDD
jgi:cytidylate kinase